MALCAVQHGPVNNNIIRMQIELKLIAVSFANAFQLLRIREPASGIINHYNYPNYCLLLQCSAVNTVHVSYTSVFQHLPG